MSGRRVLRVVRNTALRTAPASTADVVLPLLVGEIVEFAGERAGEWIKVSVTPPAGERRVGWVWARDIRETPECRLKGSPGLSVSELIARRRAAAAIPVGDQVHAEPDDISFDTEIKNAAPDDFGGDDRFLGDVGIGEASREDEDIPHGNVWRWSPPARQPRSRSRPKAPSAAPPAKGLDVVDVSVFGPETFRAGGQCLVQAFLHTLDQRPAAEQLAKETDPETGRRGARTLATEIAQGTRVQLIFDGRGLSVDDPMQELVWRGTPTSCQFTVNAPADAAGRTCYPRVLVLLNSVPVGNVTFALGVTADAAAVTVDLRGTEARRYRYAFLSYASADRVEVLKRAQLLKAARIDFFQDLLKLEPGDRWEKRLYLEIDRCDLFLLFWSSEAKASQWVLKEAEYALARQKASKDGLPDFTPVIIEGPPPPSPPDSLREIHFNDFLIYVLAAVDAQKPKQN